MMPIVKSLSLYQSHVKKWSNCQLCHLHETRNKVVLGKGVVPADILLLGEAPGPSENILGIPFVGPAGHILDDIVKRGLAVRPDLTVFMSNLICCIPLESGSTKFEEPPEECIRACQPRLKELVEIVDPKLIVTVGSYATDYLDQKWKKAIKLDREIPQVSIVHPAAILRASIAHQSLMVQKQCVKLQSAVVETFGVE